MIFQSCNLKYYLALFILSFSTFAFCSSLTLEGGAFWQRRNDVKIPSQSGTLISFDEFDQGPFPHYRVELNYDLNKRHEIRFVYAPLKLSVTGATNLDFNFNGQNYLASTPFDVRYQFNSYRIGYSYLLIGTEQTYFRFGLTGKIRDAEISFLQRTTQSTYDNLGFVPLLYYAAQIKLGDSWALFNNADFAAAKQGRALDIALKLKKTIGPNSTFSFGVRGLEGGAKNDKVFTFSFFTYAIADLSFYW